MKQIALFLVLAITACVPKDLRYGGIHNVIGPKALRASEASGAVYDLAYTGADGGERHVSAWTVNKRYLLTAGVACTGSAFRLAIDHPLTVVAKDADLCLLQSATPMGAPLVLGGVITIPTLMDNKYFVMLGAVAHRGDTVEYIDGSEAHTIATTYAGIGTESYWSPYDATYYVTRDAHENAKGSISGHAADEAMGAPVFRRDVVVGMVVGRTPKDNTKTVWLYDIHRFLTDHNVDYVSGDAMDPTGSTETRIIPGQRQHY